jgi:hypothetical protein
MFFSACSRRCTFLLKVFVVLTIFLIGYSTAIDVFAAVPRVINYQAQLKTSAGLPVTTAKRMSFALYSTPTGGAPIWTEDWDGSSGSCAEVTPSSAGIFAVRLGTCTPFPASVNFADPYYLQVAIERPADDNILETATTRVPFSSAPYALNAENVTGVTFEQGQSSAFAIRDALGSDYLRFDSSLGTEKIELLRNTVIGQLPTDTFTVNASMTVGSDALKVDSVTSRVGVGTSTPTEALHISGGNLRLDGALMPNNIAGTTGQVLVSQGAGVAPAWQTLPASGGTLDDAYDFGGSGNGKNIIADAGAVSITVQDGPGIFNGLAIVGDTNVNQGILFGKTNFGSGQQAAFGFADDVNNPGAGDGLFANYNFGQNRFNFALRTGGTTSSDLLMGNPLLQPAGTQLQNYTGSSNILSLSAFGVGNIVQHVGSGVPEGVTTADSGSIYYRVDGSGSAEQLYVKTTDGSSNGWVALGGSSGGVLTADNGLSISPASNVQLGGVLSQDTTIDGNGGVYDFTIQDLKSFSIGGGGAGSIGDIANTTLRLIGSDELQIKTPLVNSNLATNGYVLALQDATTGRVEYVDPSTLSTGAWSLLGNAGTVPGTNFIGTTDNTDLVFKTNNAQTGLISNDGLSIAFGLEAGTGASRNNTLYFGQYAGTGAENAAFSNFFGFSAGDAAINASNSNFFGLNAGRAAINAPNSNFFGQSAGERAENAASSIFIGEAAGANDPVNNTTGGTSILIGKRTNTGGFSDSIALGANATNTATNQFMVGPSYSNWNIRGVEYIMPGAQGGVATVLTNDGSGNLSWEAAGSGSVTASNGLTAAGVDVRLGGILNQVTAITATGNDILSLSNGGLTNNSAMLNVSRVAGMPGVGSAFAATAIANGGVAVAENVAGKFNATSTLTGTSTTNYGVLSSANTSTAVPAIINVGGRFVGSSSGGSINQLYGTQSETSLTGGTANVLMGSRSDIIMSNGTSAANAYAYAASLTLGGTSSLTRYSGYALEDNNTTVANTAGLFLGTSANVNYTGQWGVYNALNRNNVFAGNTAIGQLTAPSTRLQVTSSAANTSGLRLTNLTSSTPTSVGQAIGVDASGNVITVLPSQFWQLNSNVLSPATGTNYQIAITNNSASTLTGFKATNTNDVSNYAGSVLELKGSGADLTNNVYLGKYGSAFSVPSWAGNGVLATDKSLVLSAVGASSAMNFQVGGGYAAPTNKMLLDSDSLDLLSANLFVSNTGTTNVAQFVGSGSTQCTVVTGTGWSCTSDERLKEGIVELGGASEVINRLNPVSFSWKSGGDRQYGFLAQEVEQVLPGLVMTMPSGDKSLQMTGLIPFMVQTQQEQNAKLTSQQSQLTQLLAADQLSRVAESTVSLTSTQIEQLQVSGGLRVAGPVEFQSTSIFRKLATFMQDLLVEGSLRVRGVFTAESMGRVISVDRDAAGTVKILPGATFVRVKFQEPYRVAPVITLTARGLYEGLDYAVRETSTAGFTVEIRQTRAEDVVFNWIAVAVDGAAETASQEVQVSPSPASTLSTSQESATQPLNVPSPSPSSKPPEQLEVPATPVPSPIVDPSPTQQPTPVPSPAVVSASEASSGQTETPSPQPTPSATTISSPSP